MDYSFAIKDYYQESHLFLNRALATLVLVCFVLIALISRLAQLQILQNEHYGTLSSRNRIKILPLPPTRGLIYDRNGVLLAENRPTYSLEIVPEQTSDTKTIISELKKIIDITDHDIERFNRLLKEKRRFDSVPIRHRLTEKEVARFAVRRNEYPGVDIEARLDRHYPLGELTAHVLGYVGRINKKELQQFSDSSVYAGTNHIGKTGIEKAYEKSLHGQVGIQQVETNALGRILRVLTRTDPIPGEDLVLHLDIALQKAAMDALGDYNGAIVVLEIASAGVLAMISKPGFDPNLFVNGIAQKDYRELNQSPDKPLFDRALHGQYPPGSTIKPFIGLAGLEANVISPQQENYCPSFYSLPNSSHKYRCWKKWGHGHNNLFSAIEQSCDVYFYELAYALGIDRIHTFLRKFGFGVRSGIDLIGERAGLSPSREWKLRTKNQAWFPGETINTGIGQGFMLTTPLQLAHVTATLARKGTLIQPQLVNPKFLQHASNSLPKSANQKAFTTAAKKTPIPAVVLTSPGHWDTIFKTMIGVVHGNRGTARAIGKDAGYIIAGKTGTAQVFTIKQDEEYIENEVPLHLRDHALFIAFAPADKPEVAISIVVENGGHGSTTAAPIARKIFDHYMQHRKKNND